MKRTMGSPEQARRPVLPLDGCRNAFDCPERQQPDIDWRRAPQARMVGPFRPTRRVSCSGMRARRSSGWRRSRRSTTGRSCVASGATSSMPSPTRPASPAAMRPPSEVSHSAAYDSPARASSRPGFEHEDTAGTPGQRGDSPMRGLLLAIWRLPGSARVVPAPGQTHYSATRPTHREDQGDAARPRGPGRDPAALGPDRAPANAALRRNRPPRFDSLAYKRRNVIERSFNDHKQW